MIRLLIADDEERVCRLIQALGDWERLGIQVVGTAGNGIDALNLIDREQVDILITDIRMPGCSGLELIERVRRISSRIRIVIISGYASFDYAQTALKAGVNDYLLKPINKEALNDSLEKLAEQIRQEQDRERVYEGQGGQQEERVRLHRALVTDLVTTADTALTEEILSLSYQFHTEKGLYQCLAAKLDVPKQEKDGDSARVCFETLEEELVRDLEPVCHDLALCRRDTCLYGVLHYSSREADRIRSLLRSVLNRMIARRELYGKAELTFGVSPYVKNPTELSRAMLLAGRTVSERLLEGTQKVLELDVSRQGALENRLLDRFSRGLEQALEQIDREALLQACQEFSGAVQSSPRVHGWEILEIIREAGHLVLLRFAFPDRQEIYGQFEHDLDNCSTLEALTGILKTLAAEQMDRLILAREEDANRPVRIAKQFIHRRLGEPITLEEVSEAAGLSPAYFSVLFKKETGQGFARYLMGERMEAAKGLLRETSLPVGEICRQVGYSDQKHFAHLFEKAVGVKPTVYRKLYG